MDPKRFQVVIWDLDGTLIDSEELHYQSWRKVMASCNIDYSRAEFVAGFGQTSAAVFQEYLGPDLDPVELDRLVERKAGIFLTDMRDNLQLMPGAAAWLDEFRDLGMCQVVASSAPMASIVAVLHELKIGAYFTALLSGALLPRSKPDPALFRQASAAVNAPLSSCLVLEDSQFGIEAAHRAGMVCLAVGPRSEALVMIWQQNRDATFCVPVPDLSATCWRETRHRVKALSGSP